VAVVDSHPLVFARRYTPCGEPDPCWACFAAGHCVPVKCVEASVDLLSLVHTPELIEFVQCMAEGRPPSERCLLHGLSSDTYVNSHTYMCARLAAGGAAEVARAVAEGQAAHGAAIIRPPGHHAESNVAQGFCFFNNAAVAARAAQATGKAQRVLILDWDIHHGKVCNLGERLFPAVG
jgi:histone deacetylase 6